MNINHSKAQFSISSIYLSLITTEQMVECGEVEIRTWNSANAKNEQFLKIVLLIVCLCRYRFTIRKSKSGQSCHYFDHIDRKGVMSNCSDFRFLLFDGGGRECHLPLIQECFHICVTCRLSYTPVTLLTPDTSHVYSRARALLTSDHHCFHS